MSVRNFLVKYLFLITSLIACNFEVDQRYDGRRNPSSFKTIIKIIEPDSLKGIFLNWRSKDLLMLRYNSKSDSSESDFSFPLSLKRLENEALQFWTPNGWIDVDSITNHLGILDTMGLTKERIVYCYNIMEDHGIKSISCIKNGQAIIFDINDNHLYYTFDSSYFGSTNIYTKVKSLGNNWWIRDETPTNDKK